MKPGISPYSHRPTALDSTAAHVGQPLVEEQRKDELLVVAGVDEAAEDNLHAPEV